MFSLNMCLIYTIYLYSQGLFISAHNFFATCFKTSFFSTGTQTVTGVKPWARYLSWIFFAAGVVMLCS